MLLSIAREEQTREAQSGFLFCTSLAVWAALYMYKWPTIVVFIDSHCTSTVVDEGGDVW